MTVPFSAVAGWQERVLECLLPAAHDVAAALRENLVRCFVAVVEALAPTLQPYLGKHAHAHTHTYACTRTHARTRMHTHAHARTRTHTQLQTQTMT
jgi:hypothetical protein